MSKLLEKRNEFEAKAKKLHDVFEQAGPEIDLEKVTTLDGTTKDKADKIKAMNKELEDLGIEVEKLAELDVMSKSAASRVKGMVQPAAPSRKEGDTEPKTIGELFVESKAFKERQGTRGPIAELDIDLKTLMTTSTSWAPQAIRTGKVVDYATRPIQVVDVIPGGTTDQNAIVYMEETTFTNNAAEATEGSGAYGEAALALTERSSSVRKIAVWIPATQEQFEDVPGIQSYVTNRLTFMLRQRLDYQILNGNGTPPNLTGLVNVSGVQTYAVTGDKFDALYEIAKKIKVTGRSIPNLYIFHPNDWQEIRLMRTNDGLYILGNPNEPGPSRIWGLPVVETDAMVENTVLCGDFANHVQLFEKRGIEVDITDSHDTYFIYGKIAIRASFRVALPVYRPAAFCMATGM